MVEFSSARPNGSHSQVMEMEEIELATEDLSSQNDNAALQSLDPSASAIFAPSICDLWTVITSSGSDLAERGYLGTFRMKYVDLPLPIAVQTSRFEIP